MDSKEGYKEVYKENDVLTLLQDIHNRILTEKPQLSLPEETAAKAIEQIPMVGGILSLWIQRWLEYKKVNKTTNNFSPIRILRYFKKFFIGAKGVVKIQNHVKEIEKNTNE